MHSLFAHDHHKVWKPIDVYNDSIKQILYQELMVAGLLNEFFNFFLLTSGINYFVQKMRPQNFALS